MLRRDFLAGLAAGAALAGAETPRTPLGLNTYCLRALKWNDSQLLDYCAALRLDACFLQDSLDPGINDPAHWAAVREQSKRLGLRLETGAGAILPKTREEFPKTVEGIRHGIRRAAAMGSPLMRCLIAGDRAHFPPGPVAQHMETAVRLFRAVRSEALDANVKIAIENHKDLQAWETRQVIEAAGKEFVGSYLDTGNPVFIYEDPMTTVETLAPLAVTFHLRDSVVYEEGGGIAVQWVPLGEGVMDFPRLVARFQQLNPNHCAIYIKPITGRPPQVLPVFDSRTWESLPNARAAEFARFLAIAKRGRAYDRPMVVEDIPGRKTPEAFVSAIQFQQKEHMERSIAYAREKLGLGRRI